MELNWVILKLSLVIDGWGISCKIALGWRSLNTIDDQSTLVQVINKPFPVTIIGSDNGLSPGRRQAIIWTKAGILLIEPLGTNFSEILIEI